MEPTLITEGLASLPALLLEAIWSRLSFVARRNLRAACRNLRLRIDTELLQTAVVPSYDCATHNPSLLSHAQLPPEVRCILKSTSSQARGSAVQTMYDTVPATAPYLSPVGLRQTRGPEPALTAASANPAGASSTASSTFTTGRFQSLRVLVLTGGVASYTHRPSFPTALRPASLPTPTSFLAPFTSAAASLSHLVLLDPALLLSE
ncbi:hypothetical protein Vretimale_9493, partial [Volvox reticuliferus]